MNPKGIIYDLYCSLLGVEVLCISSCLVRGGKQHVMNIHKNKLQVDSTSPAEEVETSNIAQPRMKFI